MEKWTPHYRLSVVKSVIRAGRVHLTKVALNGGKALGFNDAEIVDVVMALVMEDFYKSMTTKTDHKVWQDVYRPITRAGVVYLKLTVVDDVLIVSFKEL